MYNDVTLEIFKMPDVEDDFYTQYPFLCQYRSYVEKSYKASSRRKEILSEKILIERLFPGEHIELQHNDDGKPMLSNGYNISISHTRNYIAVMVSDRLNVALDIEHISDRVKKVARMYLRDDEEFTETNDMLVAWCVKETMYKLFSSQKLTFEEIRIAPFRASEEGTVKAQNVKTGQIITLKYKVSSEYVLTTACI